MKFYQECENCKKISYEGTNGKEAYQFLCDICFFEVCLDNKIEFKQLKPLTIHPAYNYIVYQQRKNKNCLLRVLQKFQTAIHGLFYNFGFNREANFMAQSS